MGKRRTDIESLVNPIFSEVFDLHSQITLTREAATTFRYLASRMTLLPESQARMAGYAAELEHHADLMERQHSISIRTRRMN